MAETTKLDRIDIKILAALQAQGRLTNAALSDLVGLSPSPCLQRVKRLEAAGYIAGYGAELDLGRILDSITVFTEVTLREHTREQLLKFEADIRQIEEVMECHLVSGGYDYLLKVVARGVAHYQAIVERLLDRNAGIEKYFSYIVIKSPLIRRAAPLQSLLDAEW